MELHKSENIEVQYFNILDKAKTEDNYLQAIQLCPDRLDAIYGLSLFCFKNYDYEHAYKYAELGVMLNTPTKYKLKHDTELYKWKIHVHFIKMSYYYGEYQKAINIGIKLIKANVLPKGYIDGVLSDIKWCTEKLQRNQIVRTTKTKTGKIAFVCKKTKHLETLGSLANMFKSDNIDFYTNSTSYLNHSKKTFKNIRKADLNKLEFNLYLYDYIFLLNPKDIETITEKYKLKYSRKIILVCSDIKDIYTGYKSLLLSPTIAKHIETEYFLPIHDGYGKIDFKKKNIILSFRSDNFIDKYTKGYTINIITDNTKLLCAKNKHVNVFNNVDIRRKLDMITDSKFMIVYDYKDISLAYNHNIPIIISAKLNLKFKLEGIIYQNSISEVIDQVINITDIEYLELVLDLIKNKNNVCLDNKRRLKILLD